MESKAMSKRVIAIALAVAALAGCSTQAPEPITTQPTSAEKTPDSVPSEEDPILLPREFDVRRTIQVLADAYGGDDERLTLVRGAQMAFYMPPLGIAGAVTARHGACF